MKKIIVALLAIALLVGCSSKPSSESAESAESSESEPSYAFSFEYGTNSYRLRDLVFSVPDSWPLDESRSDDDTLIFSALHGWLAVACTDEGADALNLNSGHDLAVDYTNTLVDVEIEDTEECTVCGHSAYRTLYSYKTKEKRAYGDVIFLLVNDRLYRFTMANNPNSNADYYYKNDFQDILVSVVFDPETEQEESSEESAGSYREWHDSIQEDISEASDVPDDSPKVEQKTPEPAYLGSGQYMVGADLQAGEYVLFVDDGEDSAYFSVSSDANSDDILFNDNFYGNSIITVYDGEFLELRWCHAVPSGDVESIPADGQGMFLVGRDIEAGTYKVISIEDDGSGYYCIYNDSRHDDIESNDFFSNQAYATVNDGQYLVLTGCILEGGPQ